MSPVSVIKLKLRPCFDISGFVHSRYDEAEVVNDGFIVHVKYTFASSLFVAPCGDKFDGEMVVRFACQFANSG